MLTTIIHTKSTIEGILNGQPDGVDREYFVNTNSSNRLDELVDFAYSLSLIKEKVYIEVKFNSIYTNRNKRLEVVAIDQNVCTIYKFSSNKRFDKDAIELSRIAEEIKEKDLCNETTIKGVLIINTEDLDFIKTTLDTMSIEIDVISKK